MTRLIFVLMSAIAALGIAGCATTGKGEPEVRIVEKAVPTPVPCVSESVRRAPTYPDTDEAVRAAPSASERYALIAAGRRLRNQRLAEIEPVIEACRGFGG